MNKYFCLPAFCNVTKYINHGYKTFVTENNLYIKKIFFSKLVFKLVVQVKNKTIKLKLILIIFYKQKKNILIQYFSRWQDLITYDFTKLYLKVGLIFTWFANQRKLILSLDDNI